MTDQHAFQIRRLVLEMAAQAGTAHIASALSIADLLAVLHFGGVCDPLGDDRFILSKGHAASALYATLALAGRIDRDELVRGYCQDGGRFAGHPERGVAGIEATTGSLGHGLAIAVGGALADRSDGSARRTFCLVGDGELNEGSVWEAIMLAGQLGLGSLTLLVDENGLQGLGRTHDIIDLGPLPPKLCAFRWDAVAIDGHDHEEIRRELAVCGERPRALVARTVKGFGVPQLEDDVMGHYRSFRPHQLEELLTALRTPEAA
jgi:transketolase